MVRGRNAATPPADATLVRAMMPRVNNVLEFTKGMPEVQVGDVLIAEVK
jgi:hypothetical protein